MRYNRSPNNPNTTFTQVDGWPRLFADVVPISGGNVYFINPTDCPEIVQRLLV